MTEPHTAVITRLSADFAAISRQLARVSTDLVELDRILADRPQSAPAPWPQPVPVPSPVPVAQPVPVPSPAPVPQPVAPYRPAYPAYPAYPPASARVRKERSDGWIGKLLAVAGVAVTLIGVVLLLVLAAQAGILRPEFRVAAGAVLAGALVAAGWWLNGRPGGRVGAIALVATGVAAAYMDVIAVTTIYEWTSAPAGLVFASLIAGGGLTLARRWDSEHLGLLVLVPLIGLAPIVTDGISLLLVGFMLALAAVSLPVQLGKDWIWLHAARIAAAALPVLTALLARHFESARQDLWLAGASGIAAAVALVAALILLPGTKNRAAMALLTAAGVLPVLCVSLAVDRVVAALMAATLAAALLAIVLVGERLPGVAGVVRQVFSATSAVAALIAVTVAFDGMIAGPVLLAMAVVVALVGRRDEVARWAAIGFAVVGAGVHLSYSPPSMLLEATRISAAAGISTLVSAVLLAAAAVAVVWAWDHTGGATGLAIWIVPAAVVVYAVTSFTVTAGMLIGGGDGGFYAGHMAATICWIAMAAALFGYAARLPREDRSMLIGGGLGLVAAAMAKLFLFDLGTLDGIFRVAVFIVVGLILLGMGAGYARLLEKQDKKL
ncbi:DUF2339 domain-containing protein [Mycolicibacterium austroafricanum]|uniref:DUF2339 domain-containing protein n=1 Tax=Mycolicibacterium austroafricanum TaxID=39687 RepID=UPI00056D471F|nr:DUF2339 domain-containing protein [Mycolicibacterium austroafricanum]PQP42403.1 DUF2339 domain-containing protein [Mycolicibacterium austroafricanum]QZT59554.1 DUF2339 domain-containing protein [Mycolicibacterium austroafricanum]QZY48823.1 DUF2339 domain-containing protein [Mycolicibacterium austroafricanum]